MRRKRGERVEWGRHPPLLSCEEAPSINSGSLHTARNRISFACASGGSFRRVAFDALEALGGKRVDCTLGDPTCRRPVLPGPAPPRRPAVRRRTPTRPVV